MNNQQTNKTMQSPTYSKFISINPRVPLNDMMGWADNGKGKMVPKALWAITKRVGKGCRANADKKRHGFTLTAWQKTPLQQLEHFMKQAEAKLVAALPKQAFAKLPDEFQMACAPSIRSRRKRDYEARQLWRQKKTAEAAGQVFVPPAPVNTAVPKSKSAAPPSPTDISLFPAFGKQDVSPTGRPKLCAAWDPTIVAKPPKTTELVVDRLILAPVVDANPDVDVFDDDSDWDDEEEEAYNQWQHEEDLVIFD
jgi:hypothetical protein